MCITCTYSPTGNFSIDIALLVSWLTCQLVNIWGCEAMPILVFIWGVLLAIMHEIAWIPIWAADEMSIAGGWLNGNTLAVVYYLNGALFNATNLITTAIYYSGGAHTTIIGGGGGTIWDVLIAFINQLGGVLHGLLDDITQIINTLVPNLAGIIITLINAVLGLAFLLFQFALFLLNSGLTVITDIINLFTSTIPAILGAFSQGFSQASYGTVSVGSFNSSGALAPGTVPGKFDCTDPIIYHVCLGLYVLDNTIFSGSPGYVAVTLQIIVGLVFVNVLVWAIRRFQRLKAS
jgi:hypothetical protein